jgi:hypothetical protein
LFISKSQTLIKRKRFYTNKNFQIGNVITFNAITFSVRLLTGKEKASWRAAEFLVVGFSCEVETQPRDFAVALDEELAHAKERCP